MTESKPDTERRNQSGTESKQRRKSTKRAPFELAGHVVEAGAKLQFTLPAVNFFTNTPLDMSIEVLHGKREGPVLLVCAAIHGDELNGVEIIRRMLSFRSLGSLRGTLILVPVVNLFGFVHQSRYLPDRRDLNRCFPGSERGSLASRLANLFFQQIVRHCTHVIDLHTAAINRDNLPQVRAALDQPGVREMALGFSIPVIINSNLTDNTLRSEAGKVGIPVITYEAGEALRLDERAIVSGVRGVMGVMRTLGMLPPRRSARTKAEPYIARSSNWVRASSDGMFRSLCQLGSRVRAGDKLGIISAPFSAQEVLLMADFDGIVIGMNKLPLVNEGDALFHIARFGRIGQVEQEIQAHGSSIEEDRLYEIESLPVPDDASFS